MAIGCKETVVSLDINFSNGGSGHTATVSLVKNAKDLGSDNQDSLGTAIAVGGGKTTFSNKQIEDILRNFTEVQSTISQDSRKTTISRKYEDDTSLMLKSHAIVVRGRDSHPTDSGSSGGSYNPFVNSSNNDFSVSVGKDNSFGGCGSRQKSTVNMPTRPLRYNSSRYAGSSGGSGGDNVVIPYFGEVVGSPVNSGVKYPYRPPQRYGSIVCVGNIYNEESSIAYNGEKVSLVYQSGKLQQELSFNDQLVGAFYKGNPDYSNYGLKYGYTLSEAKSAFAQVGIYISGLPTSNSILLTESGTLDSVLSSIASKFGYYWYVDPFAKGRVVMINSLNASQIRITNPLTQNGSLKSKYLSGSFSTDYKRPKIVDLYASTIERQENTNEMPDADRLTRIHRWNPQKFIEQLDFNEDILKAFFIFYVSGKMHNSQLFTLYSLLVTVKAELDWGEAWPDGEYVAKEDKWKKYKDIFTDKGEFAEKTKMKFDLKKATFMPLFNPETYQKLEDISSSDAFDKLKLYFDCITSSLYISHQYGRWKATRMAFKNSPMNLEGPFDIDKTNIGDTDAFANFSTALKRLNKDPKEIKLNAFWKGQDSVAGSGSHAFFGFNDRRTADSKDLTPEDMPWEKFKETLYHPAKQGEGIHAAAGNQYLAFSKECYQLLGDLYNTSKKLWDDFTSKSDSMKATYNRMKRPVSVEEEEKDKEKQEKESKKEAEKEEFEQKIQELSERFDLRKYSMQTNGASGSPLNPIQLNISNLSLSDARSLKQAGISSAISNQGSLVSSSRTIVGLSLPESFSISISGISLKLGSSGITTTINESSVKVLRPDEQVILANSQASTSSNFGARFSAGQRNFMGL
jgi:hypothetical protein